MGKANERVLPKIDEKEYAFQLFVVHGNKSYVARQLERSLKTIYSWSKDNKWEERVAKIRSSVPNESGSDLTAVKQIQNILVDTISTGKIKIESWSDVLATLRLLYEMGQDIRYANVIRRGHSSDLTVIKIETRGRPEKNKPIKEGAPGTFDDVDYDRYTSSAVTDDRSCDEGDIAEA